MAIIKADHLKYDWYTKDTISLPREAFFADRRYVLFRYNRNACEPGATYLMNATDSVLALYSTTQFNGLFTRVDNELSIIKVRPHHFMRIDGDIHNKFEMPMESTGNVPKGKRNKSVTEWTIALSSDAIDDVKRIKDNINPIRLHQLFKDQVPGPGYIPIDIFAPTYEPNIKTFIKPKTKLKQTDDAPTADDSK